MKGPTPGCPLPARRSSLVVLIFVLLTSASSLVSTRSVDKDESNFKESIIVPENVRKTEKVGEGLFPKSTEGISGLDDGESAINREGKLFREKMMIREEEDEAKSPGGTLTDSPTRIRADSADSGIRRFDAIVVNDEATAGRVPIVGEVEKPEILKTVVRGITVRDGPVNADDTENAEFDAARGTSGREKRERSLQDSPSVDASVVAQLEENIAREETEASTDDAIVKNVDPVESHKVPLLAPVAARRTEASVRVSPEHVDGSLITVDGRMEEKNSKRANEQSGHVDESRGTETSGLATVRSTEIIAESNQADEKIDERKSAKDVVAPEIKKMDNHEINVGEVEKDLEEPDSNARSVSLTEEKQSGEQANADRPKAQVINQNFFNSTSLSSLLKTDASLEELKTQAISLQESIRNKTFLQRLRDDTVEILPKIPKFTEIQLFHALSAISASKKPENHSEYSHLGAIDTSMLSESQLRIVRCAEALVVREQRKTFAENMMECIRGLSVLNCMKIFIWPIIVDNLPESFTQNLPTLPIEVNVADWWSGEKREKPKDLGAQSPTSSHRYRFVTPETVVSNILKDALRADANIRTDRPMLIDFKNETLSKLLTSGQLEILRMGEMFLPESSRREYAERMYSCVRRFEYFSCVKYFTWPMVKQHFTVLPDFPDYQSWYPSVSVHPGYPILPYPSAEGIGDLPEIVEADGSRTGGPKPETVIVEILENALGKKSEEPALPADYYPTGHRGVPLPSVTADQMTIFYTAEKLIPPALRPEFMSKTVNCVRNYGYLTCAKYSTWPSVRQFYPQLPEFPDFSGWWPTFSLPELPDFSEYITNIIGLFPTFPGASGQKPATTPKPEAQPQPQQPIAVRPPYQPSPQPQEPPAFQPQPQQPQSPPLYPQPIPPLQSQPPQHPLLPVIRPQPQLPNAVVVKPPYFPQTQPEPQPVPQVPPESQTLPQQPEPELQPELQPGPDRPSYLPRPQSVQIIPDRPPYQSSEKDSIDWSSLSKEREGLSQSVDAIENRVIEILSNIRLIVLAGSSQRDAPITRGTLDVLSGLSYKQLKILGLSKGVIPVQLRYDLDARFVGCLQGGSDFLSCTKNVIWPTLRLYVKDIPHFPREDDPNGSKVDGTIGLYSASPKTGGFSEHYVITPAIYQPIVRSPVDPAGRSPARDEIVAESDESSSANQLRQEITEKSSGPLTPVISITDTRFTPIFTDHPETVLLAVLTAVRSYSKIADDSQTGGSSEGSFESLKNHLSPNQLRVLRMSENLLPISARADFVEKISSCAKESNFMDCSRDIVWPTVGQYYPLLPSFPNFYIDEASAEKEDAVTFGSEKKMGSDAGVPSSVLSETDVKTGQHGEAMVTITDTRFVPIFSQHPEAMILAILKDVQRSLLNSSGQQATSLTDNTPGKSWEFPSTVTDDQENIITVAGSLLPESIRQLFNQRMAECMKETGFFICTRDIAWPTIAQFFPRLPNFPNIGAASGANVNDKPVKQSAVVQSYSEPDILAKSTLALHSENFVPATGDDEVEARIESTLKDVSPATKTLTSRPKEEHSGTKDPLVSPLVTERQASVIRMCEDLLPNSVKPIFVGKMVECSRSDVFPNCIRDVGWPTLRQHVPNIPELPDFGSFGPYIPQVVREVPVIPQFSDYQLPTRVTNIPGLESPGPGFVLPLQTVQGGASHGEAAYLSQGRIIGGGQPGGFYLGEFQGLAPSVDSSTSTASGANAGSTRHSSVVSAGLPSSPASDVSVKDEADESIERRRKRRSLHEENQYAHQDFSSNDLDPLALNITESEFLKILINVTNERGDKNAEDEKNNFLQNLNTTIKESLTADQYRILKIIENIGSQTDKAGFMSKVVQCVMSLSFIRCMGIFVWPLIIENVPTLLGLPALGSLNPFGRSRETNDFREIFGRTSDEFERELLERKGNVEGILVDWYRGLVEEKFDKDFGFVKIHGYGDGEIGISFNDFGRTSRVAKIRDNKNLPSILTIISDIMEDMLDQREPKPDYDRKKESVKRDKARNDRSLRDRFVIDRYNEVSAGNSGRESSNDDNIIAMFLDKIRVNETDETSDASNWHDNLGVEDPREAFELLFGTKLSEKLAERKFDGFRREDPSSDFGNEESEDGRGNEGLDAVDGTPDGDIRSGLILTLPRIDEDIIGRKITAGLMDLGRKMKMQMSQLMPGISFVASFFIQMALAHARAAASVAGMMSNMALGSAMLTMVRQTLFGPSSQPKIKYVYDNAPIAPGITWPRYDRH